MNEHLTDTEANQRREDFALEAFTTLLAAHPSKTYASLAGRAVAAADALIAALDAPR